MNGKYREMTPRFRAFCAKAGARSSARAAENIFASMGAENSEDKVKKMIDTYHAMQLDALVILGGNSGKCLRERGSMWSQDNR